MDYNFKFSLTEDEFAEFSAYTGWLSPEMKKKRVGYILRNVLYFLIAYVAFITITSRFLPAKKHNYTILISFALAGILFFIFFINYQTPFSLRSKAKKMLQKEENKHFLYESELSFNDVGITASDILSTNNFKWSSIVKYAVTKDFYYLYMNSIQALIVPKRLFKSQMEVERFGKFLSEKTPLSSSFRSMGI